MNWTFAKLRFDGWEHKVFNTKSEALEAGKAYFKDQFYFFVGRLEEMAAHKVVVDTEKVLVN